MELRGQVRSQMEFGNEGGRKSPEPKAAERNEVRCPSTSARCELRSRWRLLLAFAQDDGFFVERLTPR